MNPLFKNITKYNSENYEQFIEFHNKKFGFSYNTYTIIMTTLLIYCVIINIVQKNFLFMLVFLVLLVVLLLFRIYLPMKRYKETQEQYVETEESDFIFSFYKHYFTLNETTFYYFKLYKIFETKDYFYLYIDEDNAALVNKNGFEFGTSEEFADFIKKKCLFRYSKQK